MGRLPDEWIDQIKSDIPIQDLVEANGVEVFLQVGCFQILGHNL